MPRRKDIETRRRVLELYNRGIHSPSEIAKRLGVPANRIRFLMHQMRREGLLPKINPTSDLLDEVTDLVKASLFRVTAVHAEMIAKGDRLAKPLAEAQDMLQRALEDISIYKRMKQLEGGRP